MNNDLISREALRKNMEFICMGIMAGTEPYNAPLTEIDNAPAVDIKDEIAGAYNEGYMCGHREAEKGRPQGKWIDVVNGDYPSVWHYECSECHERPLCTPFTKEDFLSRFCPNCGAYMRGKEE